MKGSTAYAISKKFTSDTAEQFGAVKGASCQVGNITYDADGNTLVELIWKNDAGVTKTSTALIQRGLQGEQGDKGDKGDKFVYDDFTPEELALLKGTKGDKGDKGVGIDTITKTSTSGIVDIYTIVYDDGTETQYSVVNGANITKISELENDENFVKATTLSLVNYYLKDESYSKVQIDELLRNVGAGLSVKIVATLPLTDISPTTIYLINTSGSNYNQYMNIDGEWANLGSTEVDMSSYYNKSQIDLKLEDYVTANRLTNKLDDYVLKTNLAKVAKSNSYNDLDDLPEIPDVSGIKPYTDLVQDSSNTAPTSKALYDAVETINGKFDDYAKAEDLDDYVTKAQGAENKGKALIVGEDGNVTVGEATTKVIDDSVVTETSTWSSKKINDSLVDKADKSYVDDKVAEKFITKRITVPYTIEAGDTFTINPHMCGIDGYSLIMCTMEATGANEVYCYNNLVQGVDRISVQFKNTASRKIVASAYFMGLYKKN